MDQVNKKQSPAKLIAISIAVAVIILVLIYSLLPRTTEQTLILDELPRAYFLYDGLTLNMDGSPEETFWLQSGFEPAIDFLHAKDGKGRQVLNVSGLRFERWQARGIAMEMGVYVESGARDFSVFLNGRPVLSKLLSIGYQDLVFELPDDALTPGENIVSMEISGEEYCAVLFDYVRWRIGQSNGQTKPEIDQRMVEGKKMDVIGSTAPYEMNFYLSAPANSRLILDISHDLDGNAGSVGTIRIWFRGISSGEKLLWDGRFPTRGSKRLDLSLNNFQDELMLLSFYIVPQSNTGDWFYLANPHLSSVSQPQKPKSATPLIMNNKEPRTIVIIFEDAMRRDALPFYGNKAIQAPNLEKIATSALVFENAYAPSNTTFTSFSSIFTSLPFTRTGAIKDNSIMVEDVQTLADVFSQHGWETAFLTGNFKSGLKQGVARGYKNVFELFSQSDHELLIPAEQYLSVLDGYLAGVSAQKDVLVVLHLLDTHWPFVIPEQYRNYYEQTFDQIEKEMPWLAGSPPVSKPGSARERAVSIYSSVSYFDTVLPGIIDTINRYRASSNTVYILLSDHGEEIGDHGFMGHGRTLYQELIHIPMMIWGDGVTSGRNKGFVSSIDLMPTLLEMSGIEVPPGLAGESFAKLLNGDFVGEKRPVFAASHEEGTSLIGVVYGNWKLIYNDSTPELYNLAMDPRETNDQAFSNPIAFGFMRGIIWEWWMEIHAQGVKENQKQLVLNDRDIEILKGLGYMQK